MKVKEATLSPQLNFTHGGRDPRQPKKMICVGVPEASLEKTVAKLVPLGYKVVGVPRGRMGEREREGRREVRGRARAESDGGACKGC